MVVICAAVVFLVASFWWILYIRYRNGSVSNDYPPCNMRAFVHMCACICYGSACMCMYMFVSLLPFVTCRFVLLCCYSAFIYCMVVFLFCLYHYRDVIYSRIRLNKSYWRERHNVPGRPLAVNGLKLWMALKICYCFELDVTCIYLIILFLFLYYFLWFVHVYVIHFLNFINKHSI